MKVEQLHIILLPEHKTILLSFLDYWNNFKSAPFPLALPFSNLVAEPGRDLSKTHILKHFKSYSLSSVSNYLTGLTLFVSSTSYSSEPLSYYTCAKWNFLQFFKQPAPSHAASGLFPQALHSAWNSHPLSWYYSFFSSVACLCLSFHLFSLQLRI